MEIALSPALARSPQHGKEQAGREMAMKHLEAGVGLTHRWETAMEGAAVEDGTVQREGGLLPSPTSFSWKFFFKIIKHEL